MVETIEGISNCDGKTNKVGGRNFKSYYDSHGIQFITTGEVSTINNPVTLNSGEHYAFQSNPQMMKVKVGTMEAYKDLANKKGHYVTDHTSSYSYREYLDIIRSIETSKTGEKSYSYMTIKPGNLQTFNVDFVYPTTIEPLSESQISELISLEHDPIVREGLKKYINGRTKFSYNFEQDSKTL